MKLLLATSNLMAGGAAFRRASADQSSVELLAGLRANIAHAQVAVARSGAGDKAAAQPQQVQQQPTKDQSSSPSPTPSSTLHTAAATTTTAAAATATTHTVAVPPWTARTTDNATLLVPAPSLAATPPAPPPGLAADDEDRAGYDMTAKLFFLSGLPPWRRGDAAREAMGLVLRELGVAAVDLLIVSFPGVGFGGEEDEDEEDEDEDEDEDWKEGKVDGEREGDKSRGKPQARARHSVRDDIDSITATWHALEPLVDNIITTINGTNTNASAASTLAPTQALPAHPVHALGVAELDHPRLAALCSRARVPPAVDQISVKDCCVVPRELIAFAKGHGIRLLTHDDSTDILPRGATRELLGCGGKGVGLLAERPGTGAGDGSVQGKGQGEKIPGDVTPLWVVKYTAVVKDRGVIENKGYFAMAEIQ